MYIYIYIYRERERLCTLPSSVTAFCCTWMTWARGEIERRERDRKERERERDIYIYIDIYRERERESYKRGTEEYTRDGAGERLPGTGCLLDY